MILIHKTEIFRGRENDLNATCPLYPFILSCDDDDVNSMAVGNSDEPIPHEHGDHIQWMNRVKE